MERNLRPILFAQVVNGQFHLCFLFLVSRLPWPKEAANSLVEYIARTLEGKGCNQHQAEPGKPQVRREPAYQRGHLAFNAENELLKLRLARDGRSHWIGVRGKQ